MNTVKFILNLIAWAMALAFLGNLPEMTRMFRDKAVAAHSRGLLSLGALSRELESRK